MARDTQNPLALARFELKRFRGPLPRLALGFILIIPMLYGCIYLAGNWDPYGRLDTLPVAVVNHDSPITINDSEMHAGKDFVDSLHRNATFDFIDTTEAEAADGLEQGRYYLTITVPESFSADLVSGQGNDPTRAQIMMRRNDANGFVIGTITNSAQNSIARAIDETAVQSYFDAVFANLANIRSGMDQAATGAAQLSDGLITAKEGSVKLRAGAADASTGATALATGATSLKDGAARADKGATDLVAGLDKLSDGAGKLSTGASQVADGTQALADVVDPVLSAAAEKLPQVQAKLVSLADTASELTSVVSSNTGSIASTTAAMSRDLNALIAANPELADDPLISKLKGHVDSLDAKASTIAGHADQIATDVAAADAALKNAGDLSGAATAAKGKIDALNAGAQQVADGAATLETGIGTAATGAQTLSSGLGELADGATKLDTGATTLATGLTTLAQGTVTLDDGLGELADGAGTLSTKLATGVKQIPTLTADEQSDAVQVLSAPVDVKMEVDNPAHVYGRGLAPMFFSIALWVLGISAFFIVRPITGRVLAARGSDVRIALTAWLPLGVISVVAGWLMLAAAWIGLGLDPVHPWLMIAMVTLVSLAFSSVAHLLRTSLGLVATAAMLILLIIQLTAAGGTYPPQLLPPFFATIGHFMPMTYTISAFRIGISGGLMGNFARDAALMVFLFCSCMALLVLVVRRRRRFSVKDLHPPFG